MDKIKARKGCHGKQRRKPQLKGLRRNKWQNNRLTRAQTLLLLSDDDIRLPRTRQF